MKTSTSRFSRLAVVALSALLASTPALADKGGKHGKGQDGNNQGDDRDDRRSYGYGSGGPPERGYGYGGPPQSGYGYINPPPVRGNDYGHPPEPGYQTGGPAIIMHFGNSDRHIINDYYGSEFSDGRCPPGLARKHNGCMPPGQAKKWRIGQTLPRDVVWYDAPGDIVLRLGMPPEGHRYVRVAADILLIAVGTGMVVDALEDLNRF